MRGEEERSSLQRVTHERILRSLQADFHRWRVDSFILPPDTMATPRTHWLQVECEGWMLASGACRMCRMWRMWRTWRTWRKGLFVSACCVSD